MKIRLYNSKNDIVQVLALENGVLIRYDGNREIWCPNADCYLDDDYNLVVVSGPNGISMQITGEFLDWDCKMYVPACKARWNCFLTVASRGTGGRPPSI